MRLNRIAKKFSGKEYPKFRDWKPPFQLKSQSPKFGQANVWLSTVELPIRGGLFESCVFYKDGESEVLERYETRSEAQKGHVRHAVELGIIEGAVVVSKEGDNSVVLDGIEKRKKRRIKFDEEV